MAVWSDVSRGLLTPGLPANLALSSSWGNVTIIHLHEGPFSTEHATPFPVAKRQFNMQKLCESSTRL